MPYENDQVADVDGESRRCWVCDGNLRPETTIDLLFLRGAALSRLWSSVAWR